MDKWSLAGKLGMAGVIFALSANALFAGDKEASRPNIIVIYADDLGFGDVGALNPESKIETPNIDRLAAEGIRFTNAHSPDAVCTPSRYGLLTGRYCWRTELKRGVLGAEAPGLIADGRMTIPSLLRDHGYGTAMVGKWHLGMDFPGTPGNRDWSKPIQDMPLDKGFDYFFGIPASLNFGILAWFEGRHAKVPPTCYTSKKPNGRSGDYRVMPPYEKTFEEAKRVFKKKPFEVAPDFVDDQCLTRFTEKAIEWMKGKTADARNGKPFMLYLPYTSSHYPVCPRKDFWSRGECGAYGEFVIETDYHVGQILDFLEESGLVENTLVFFSSDNGPAPPAWKNRIKKHGHHSNYIYRGGKFEIYEGGHRVPVIIRWPKGIKQPGRSCDELVVSVDLLATLADILGVALPPDAGEDSVSFAKVFSDPQARLSRPPLMNHAFRGQLAVTDGDWKLVLPKEGKEMELYNLSTDPGESKNVVAGHPEMVDMLKKKATKIVVNGRTSPGPVQKNDTGYWKDLGWIAKQEYQSRQQKAGQ